MLNTAVGKLLYMIESTSIVGYVDILEITSNSVLIEGWAVSLTTKNPVDYVEIHMFGNLHFIKPHYIRPDVVEALGDSKCEVCGFKAIFPVPMDNNADLEFSVYGICGFNRNRLILVNK